MAGDVALEYRHPDGCPGEAAFRERAADMFDFHDPFVAADAPAARRLRIEIERERKGYRATLTLESADGTAQGSSVERHESCDTLVYVLAHRMRMITLPAPAPTTTPPPPAPQAPPSPPLDARGEKDVWRRLDRLEETNEAQDRKIKAQNEQIAKLARDLENERRKKMDLTYTLSAGVLMTANLTSNVGPGVWLGGDLRSGPLSVGVELRAVLPSPVAVGPYDRDLSQFVGLLTPCGRYSVFFGCAVAGAGMHLDYDSNYHPDVEPAYLAPLVQLGGRIGVEVPLGESRFALRGWGEVLYSTPSVEFGYPEEGVFVDRPDVSAFFGLGFVVKLGKEGEK